MDLDRMTIRLVTQGHAPDAQSGGLAAEEATMRKEWEGLVARH